MTALRRALAAMGAAILAVALSPAASAQAAGLPALARFVTPTPAPGQVLTVSNPTIHAFVSSVRGQKLLVTVTGAANVTKEVTATSMCQEVNEVVSLANNGSYQVAITTDVPVPISSEQECQGGAAAPREFFVAAPPSPPSGVKAAMDPARAVDVSFAKNPEPDIVSYRVQRSVGAGAFQQVGEMPGTSFKDGPVPPGGPLRYQVLAVRKGKTPQETVVSAPSAAVIVGEPASTARRGSGNASGSTKPVFTGPPQPGAGGGGAATTEGAFDERLPYKPGEEAATTELGTDETSNSPHRSLAFVAGGLLALVTFLFLRCLRAEVDRHPLPG